MQVAGIIEMHAEEVCAWTWRRVPSLGAAFEDQRARRLRIVLFLRSLALSQIAGIKEPTAATIYPEKRKRAVLLLEHLAAAVACAEALPCDALRLANPHERSLEDMRLDQPELIVGCWASG